MLRMILGKSRSKSVETPYSFQGRFHRIQRIALIYPEKQKWLRIARYTLQNLYRLPERFEYLILLPEGTERPILEVSHEYGDMNYQPLASDIPDLRSRIISFNPDLLLQLEPSPSDKLEKMVVELDIPLKIGFGSESSGLNLIYAQKRSGFYEKNLLNLISLIELKK